MSPGLTAFYQLIISTTRNFWRAWFCAYYNLIDHDLRASTMWLPRNCDHSASISANKIDLTANGFIFSYRKTPHEISGCKSALFTVVKWMILWKTIPNWFLQQNFMHLVCSLKLFWRFNHFYYQQIITSYLFLDRCSFSCSVSKGFTLNRCLFNLCWHHWSARFWEIDELTSSLWWVVCSLK